MQFEPEESGEARRRRQRDYHAFLDAQVDARKNRSTAEQDHDTESSNNWLPVLPERLKHHAIAPYRVDPTTSSMRQTGKSALLNNVGGFNLDHREEIANRDEHICRLEQRLEAETQQRHLMERKLADLGQKLEMWTTDSTATMQQSLGARDAVVTEVREKTRNVDAELSRMREWRNRVEASLALAPKVQEMTQQQVKALEEEARTRIRADEARSARFRQAVERISSEVETLAQRLEVDENGTRNRVEKFEAAFTRETKNAREATRQLGAQVQALDAGISGSQDKMSVLLQSLRMLEKRQHEQQLAAAEAKRAKEETEQLRDKVHALSVAMAGSEKQVRSLLDALQAIEARQQGQNGARNGKTEEQVSKQQMQESLMAATSIKMDLLRTSLADELTGMMGDTAKRAVESTNVPQLMTALRGRVELAEERLNNMADQSLRALEDELTGVRTEVKRLEGRIDTGPIATTLKALTVSTTAAQSAAQSQLTELQDALSAEITARRRNAVRLAEAQAATQDGGRESAVQATSGLRARCLELEELVSRLTRDIHTTQEDLSSQTQNQLAAAQERNSRAVGKLEESLAGIRVQMAQQGADEDRNWARAAARADELEQQISANRNLLREAEERARNTFTTVEAKREEQAKHFTDRLAGVEAEKILRIEAIETALREQGHNLKEAIEADHRTNKRRFDEMDNEVKSLEGRLRTMIEERARNTFTTVEAKREEQAKHFTDRLAGVEAEKILRIEAIETTLREQGHNLKEAIEADRRTNKRRFDEMDNEVKSLEGRLRTNIADAQEGDLTRVNFLLQQTQEQVNREIARLRQTTDRVATETNKLREKLIAAEISRVDSVQELHRDLLTSTEALQSRMRLWAEDRMQKERITMKESLERTQQQSAMVRALLDETVQAVSKEVEILREEVKERSVAFEDSLDERTSGLEVKLTEIDKGTAKKQRVSELKKETGARIGRVECRVQQAEQELKKELEVKMAVSSLVCTVADNASKRNLEQNSLQVAQLDAKQAEAMECEASLRAELGRTNAVVAGLQAEINAAKGWRTGIDNLELKLMARIEEIKAAAEAAISAAEVAKAETHDIIEVKEKRGQAPKNVSKEISASRAIEEKAAASKDLMGAQGQQAKKLQKKKAMDFAALNDELEAEDDSSPSPSPVASNRSYGSSDTGGHDNTGRRTSDERRASSGAVREGRRESSSPSSGASYTPPLSPGSDVTTPHSYRRTTAVSNKSYSEAMGSESEQEASSGDSGSDDEGESGTSDDNSRRSNSGSEVDVGSQRGSDWSGGQPGKPREITGDEATSDADSAMSSERRGSSRSEREKNDDCSNPGSDQDEDDTEKFTSARESERSQSASSRGDEESQEDDESRGDDDSRGNDNSRGDYDGRDGKGDSASETEGSDRSDSPNDAGSRESDNSGTETEGSVTPRESDGTASGEGESDQEEEQASSDERSQSSRSVSSAHKTIEQRSRDESRRARRKNR